MTVTQLGALSSVAILGLDGCLRVSEVHQAEVNRTDVHKHGDDYWHEDRKEVMIPMKTLFGKPPSGISLSLSLLNLSCVDRRST